MSLITRCPSCGTLFKVVTDQLKISEGWVRCGKCAEVFDAASNLQPYDTVTSSPSATPAVSARSSPTPPVPPAPAPAPASTSLSPVVISSLPTARPAAEKPAINPAYSPPQRPVQAPTPPAVPLDNFMGEAAMVNPLELSRDRSAEAERQLPPRKHVGDEFMLSDLPSELENAKARRAVQWEFPPSQADFDDEPLPIQPDVSFVREAKRKAFWRRPRTRFLLVILLLGLLSLLGVQFAVQERDALAAQEPAFAATLGQLCVHIGCEIKAPRSIESILVDSSSFRKLSSDSYRLGFVIKNRGPTPVAMIALELTLTDAQDQPLIRRVLTPTELGSSRASLGPNAEFVGSVDIAIDSAVAPRVVGYRVLAFYP